MLDSVLMLAGIVCVAMAPNVEVFLLGELRVLVTSTMHSLCLQGDFWLVTAPEVTWCPVRYLWVRSHTRTCGGPQVWWPWSATPPASSWACWPGPPCPGGRLPGCLSPHLCSHLASCCYAGWDPGKLDIIIIIYLMINLGISLMAPQKWIWESSIGFLILLQRKYWNMQVSFYIMRMRLRTWGHDDPSLYFQEGTWDYQN